MYFEESIFGCTQQGGKNQQNRRTKKTEQQLISDLLVLVLAELVGLPVRGRGRGSGKGGQDIGCHFVEGVYISNRIKKKNQPSTSNLLHSFSMQADLSPGTTE